MEISNNFRKKTEMEPRENFENIWEVLENHSEGA